jgi:hypothetical protein
MFKEPVASIFRTEKLQFLNTYAFYVKGQLKLLHRKVCGTLYECTVTFNITEDVLQSLLTP